MIQVIYSALKKKGVLGKIKIKSVSHHIMNVYNRSNILPQLGYLAVHLPPSES
jgi:alpha-amylase/alpha-mannosidase (GH57 family)